MALEQQQKKNSEKETKQKISKFRNMIPLIGRLNKILMLVSLREQLEQKIFFESIECFFIVLLIF